MKKLFGSVCVLVLALTLVACGGTAGNEQMREGGSAPATTEQQPANSLEAIIQEAQADIANTSQKLADEQEKMFSEVGETYEDYSANVDRVQQWYDLAVSETEALGGRAVEYGRKYYQAVVDNVDVTDDRELDKATEDFYDAIYDDAFDDYYDAVYEDAFDEAYDTYYDGIIQDAYDVTPYDEWSDASSDAYEMWSDAKSDVYEAWSDAKSDLYSDYSDVRSAFYSNDFDVEGIFAPVEVKGDAGPDDAAASAGGTTTEAGSTSSGVNPEFKATMDGYEAFFDQYVEFMNAYEENSSSADLIAQYADMMAQYAETMQAMNDINSDSLSPSDAAYYIEVTARIAEKTAGMAQ